MITRKFLAVQISILDATGLVKVESDEIVTDDVEGTATGRRKVWNAPAVKAAAETLRDAVKAQAEQQGKPLTY